MKEFKFCGEMTEYVEIPVMVCETQKEMVNEIYEVREVSFNDYVYEKVESIEFNRQCAIKERKEHGYSAWFYDEQIRSVIGTSDETSIYIIYKDGSKYFETFGERQGKFKRYGIKAAVIETAFEYTVYGDFAVTDNGDISIEESDIEEYGVYNGQYDVKEEPEAAETVESVEETTVSETETVETEVAEKFIIYVSDDDLNVFCAKVFVGTVKELDDECDRIIAETNCEEYLHVLCYTDKRWEWVQKHYNQVSKSALSVVVRKTETAEQETELNAEVAQVEAEQTAEPETFSKSKSESESEPTAENITVSGTNQDNINVLIVADIANTFEMITHTGYFDTS